MSASLELTTPTTTLQHKLNATAQHLASVLPADASRTIDAGIAAGQQAGLAKHSIQPGQQAPDFTLPDASGAPVTLSHLLQQGPVVLVFYRGNWCPYCNVQLRAYQQALPDFTASKATLVAISPQAADWNTATSEEKELTYPVLSDVGNAVARQYGLAYTIGDEVYTTLHSVGINLEAYNGDASGELPLTATFVVDATGTIIWSEVDADFKRRPDPSAILSVLAAQ